MAKDKKEDKKTADLNEKLDDMVAAGMASTNSWCDLWRAALGNFFGRQLEGKKRHENWEWVIVNYLWPAAMQEIAKIAKNNPRILCHPWETNDNEVAEAWQSRLQWDWQYGLNKTGMRIEQIYACLDSKIFGYRVSKVYREQNAVWNDQQKRWDGEVRHRLWHPARFWASDTEKIDDGDCGTVRYVTLDWAIQRWPQFEKKLREEADKFMAEVAAGTEPIVRGALSAGGSAEATAAGRYSGGKDYGLLKSYLDNRLVGLVLGEDVTEGKKKADKEAPILKIEEICFRDYSTTDRKIEQDIPKGELLSDGSVTTDGILFYTPDGKEMTAENWPKRTVKEYKEPNYPKGRFIIRAGHTILNPDEKQQKYEFSRWPFVVVPHYPLPHMWQGSNAVEMYRGVQDMINTSLTHLYNNLKCFGDPKIIVENNTLATNPRTKKQYGIAKGAGAIIRVVRGGLNRLKFQPPIPPSAGAILFYKLMAQEFKNLTGLQNIARGEKQEGKMTATEATQLAISSQDRIYLQSIMEELWVKGVMTLVAEMEQKYSNVNDFLRIVGEDNLVGVIQITQKLKEVRFDVDIEQGSTLPFDEEKKQLKYLKAYELLSNPNPNPLLPDVLRELGIRSWKKVLDQLPAWRQYLGIKALYEQVKAGQMAPEQAVAIIVRQASQLYASETIPPQEGKPTEKEGETKNARRV